MFCRPNHGKLRFCFLSLPIMCDRSSEMDQDIVEELRELGEGILEHIPALETFEIIDNAGDETVHLAVKGEKNACPEEFGKYYQQLGNRNIESADHLAVQYGGVKYSFSSVVDFPNNSAAFLLISVGAASSAGQKGMIIIVDESNVFFITTCPAGSIRAVLPVLFAKIYPDSASA